MRRILIGGTIALVLLTGATAQAGTHRYTGTAIAGGERGKFAFKAEFERGDPSKVRRFKWTDVPVPCKTGGPTKTSGYFRFAMVVQSRNFQGTAHNGIGGHTNVGGRFRDHDQRAAGTIRVHGRLGSGFSGCDTGKVYWRAHRT